MLLEVVGLRVPEPLVLVRPPGNFTKWFGSKGDQDFTTLLLALDQPGSLEGLEVLGHSIQRRIERSSNVEKAGWPFRCELPDDRASRGMRDRRQDIGKMVHA